MGRFQTRLRKLEQRVGAAKRPFCPVCDPIFDCERYDDEEDPPLPVCPVHGTDRPDDGHIRQVIIVHKRVRGNLPAREAHQGGE